MEDQIVREEKIPDESADPKLAKCLAANRFGPPEEREKLTSEYVSDLVQLYTEPLLRRIVLALSSVPDFAPGWRLADASSAPLEQLLRPYEFPYLDIGRIERVGGLIEVDVDHGVDEEARGERFLFSEAGDSLELQGRSLRWTIRVQ